MKRIFFIFHVSLLMFLRIIFTLSVLTLISSEHSGAVGPAEKRIPLSHNKPFSYSEIEDRDTLSNPAIKAYAPTSLENSKKTKVVDFMRDLKKIKSEIEKLIGLTAIHSDTQNPINPSENVMTGIRLFKTISCKMEKETGQSINLSPLLKIHDFFVLRPLDWIEVSDPQKLAYITAYLNRKTLKDIKRQEPHSASFQNDLHLNLRIKKVQDKVGKKPLIKEEFFRVQHYLNQFKEIYSSFERALTNQNQHPPKRKVLSDVPDSNTRPTKKPSIQAIEICDLFTTLSSPSFNGTLKIKRFDEDEDGELFIEVVTETELARKIKYFILSEINIDDEDMEFLKLIFEDLDHLIELDLRKNLISIGGIQHLIEVVDGMPNLQTINLSSNLLSQDEKTKILADFKKVAPNVQIIF